MPEINQLDVPEEEPDEDEDPEPILELQRRPAATVLPGNVPVKKPKLKVPLGRVR
jgi:hypothetical protein